MSEVKSIVRFSEEEAAEEGLEKECLLKHEEKSTRIIWMGLLSRVVVAVLLLAQLYGVCMFAYLSLYHKVHASSLPERVDPVKDVDMDMGSLPLLVEKNTSSSAELLPASPAASKKDVESFLIEKSISSPGDLLEDEWCPQARALEYMASLKLSLPPEGDEKASYDYLTRYVLAVLYFATGPWALDLRFLSNYSYCYWYTVLEYPDKIQEFKGVACDEGGTVQAIFLSNNTVTGQLPTELALLTSLVALGLDSNSLSGTIPDFLAEVTNLQNIFLGDNRLTGTIPQWTNSKIQNINLSNNSLVGRINWDGAEMKELIGVALDHNQLTGDINLFSAEAFPKLEELYLDHNEFTGTLTDTVAAMETLQYLDVSHNQLSGSLPGRLFTKPDLKVLLLHENHWTGLLPEVTKENTKLEMLTLSNCKLDKQPIVKTISNLKGLEHLDLSRNDFTGTIPSQIAGLTQLEKLFLGKNGFEETDLEHWNWLPKLTALQEVSLKSTGASGPIPDLSMLSSLVLLDLDDNNLSGSIPSTLGALEKLRFLLLNRNQLFGEVPTSVMDLPNLDLLFLESNAVPFKGPICDIAVAKKGAMIVADCTRTECPCCTTCCVGGEECNDNLEVPDYDPSWKSSWKRDHFSFGPTASFKKT